MEVQIKAGITRL